MLKVPFTKPKLEGQVLNYYSVYHMLAAALINGNGQIYFNPSISFNFILQGDKHKFRFVSMFDIVCLRDSGDSTL